MYKPRSLKVFLLSILLVFGMTAYAADMGPMQTVQQIAQKMLNQLHAKGANLEGDNQALYRLVNSILIPHVDTDMMAQRLLNKRGDDVWGKATKQQRKQFIHEFTMLLVRTYSAALTHVQDVKMAFYPIRGGVSADQQFVQVKSEILVPQGRPIPLNYYLVREGSVWKVYNVNVDGVGMLENYRSQFQTLMQQGGLPKLLKKLAEHNAQK